MSLDFDNNGVADAVEAVAYDATVRLIGLSYTYSGDASMCRLRGVIAISSIEQQAHACAIEGAPPSALAPAPQRQSKRPTPVASGYRVSGLVQRSS